MTLLLSYPRSGSTWFRYVFEYVTGKTTVGQNQDGTIGANHFDTPTPGKEIVLVKRHWPTDEFDKILFLVRDYHEAIPRHVGYDMEVIKGQYDYFELVEFYEKFRGEKMVIYYEDLIQYPLEVVLNACNFLKIPPLTIASPDPSEGFALYGKSQSRGELDYHSKKVVGSWEWVPKYKTLKRYDPER